MRDSLRLLELLFVEGDVVVACNVLQRGQQVVLYVLLPLLLLHDDGSLEVQVIGLLKDIEQGWVRASVNADFLELVSEMVLDRLLLKAAALQNDVVLAFEDEAVDDEVLSL